MGADQQLGPSQQYGRIEYAYSLMAGAAGVTMTPCQLLQENGRAHFMTRRFDRDGNRRIHVQSLCAIRHMDYNLRNTHAYESLFLTALDLGLGDAAMTQLFARMAFNVAARNHDDHSKNFAFLLGRGGRWQLAPAFDVTFAYDPASLWLSQHLMSVNGRTDGITRQDVLAVADRFSIPGAKPALERVNAAVANWRQHADSAGVGGAETDRIASLHVAL
jgi:serine/threonine-protein kinase HipA